jgi:hypothetical protein
MACPPPARAPQELHSYIEPDFVGGSLSELSVILQQSEIRALRNVVERMKNFSDYILLQASDANAGQGTTGTAQLQLTVRVRAGAPLVGAAIG